MNKIPFTNETDKVCHFGSVTIWPGGTRMIGEYDHPDYKPKIKHEDKPPSLLDVLDQSVPAIIKLLPNYSDDDLATIMTAESEGKTRSTLMKEFDNEILRRESFSRLSNELATVLVSDDIPALMSMREKVSEHADLVESVEARLAELDDASKN